MPTITLTGMGAPRTPRIFVQIPAYRDRELEPTLWSLYRKAAFPARLRTVVLWQREPDDPDLRDVRDLPGLTIVEAAAAVSAGPNWARHQIQELADGEDYTLLLDSHMRFVKHWDTTVIGMLEALRRRGVAKPILTSYLPAYVPGQSRGSWGNQPYKIYPLSRDDGVLTRLTSHPLHEWSALEGPVVGEYFSLHFAFTDGAFNREVPHDPHLYFFGDEVALGLRAYTFGWDMFHPHRVLGWHAYSRSSRIPHWDEHAEWGEAHRRTLARLRLLFNARPELAHLRGTARSVTDYEQFIMQDLVAAR